MEEFADTLSVVPERAKPREDHDHKETKVGEAKTDSDCKVVRIFDNVTCLLIPERKYEKVAHR